MGIEDRNYMKRSSDEGDRFASSPDDKLEAFFSGFLEKHPRFFVHLGIAFAVLAIFAVIAPVVDGVLLSVVSNHPRHLPGAAGGSAAATLTRCSLIAI